MGGGAVARAAHVVAGVGGDTVGRAVADVVAAGCAGTMLPLEFRCAASIVGSVIRCWAVFATFSRF
eukprot:174568-Alexandrium_andersonii.AAC.1